MSRIIELIVLTTFVACDKHAESFSIQIFIGWDIDTHSVGSKEVNNSLHPVSIQEVCVGKVVEKGQCSVGNIQGLGYWVGFSENVDDHVRMNPRDLGEFIKVLIKVWNGRICVIVILKIGLQLEESLVPEHCSVAPEVLVVVGAVCAS